MTGIPDDPTGPFPIEALLDTGMIWLINRVVFHPRGFRLALHISGTGAENEDHKVIGWGLEPELSGETAWFAPEDDIRLFKTAEATLAAARKAWGR